MSDDRTKKLKQRKSRTSRSRIEVADRHLSNFEFHLQGGDFKQSFSSLSIALSTLPSLKEVYYSSFLEVFESLSTAVEEEHGFQEAVKLYEVAVKHYPDSPDINYLLANILYRHGNIYEAWSYACLSHSECTQDPNAQETQGRLANALIDRWHLPMLNDIQRNYSFKCAVEAAIKEGHNEVLDIGSGTSLLSIYAARAGAKVVYGCETDKFMYEIGNNVLKANAATDSIKIFNLHSLNLTIPKDIPKRVSLVVSETLDAGLLGEHILSTLQHAWTHLLLPPPNMHLKLSTGKTAHSSIKNQDRNYASSEIDCDLKQESQFHESCSKDMLTYGKVIPSRAEVFVALISSQYIADCTTLDDPDLIKYFKNKQVLLKLEEPYMSEKLNDIPGGFKLLSEWTPVTTIDFNSPTSIDTHLKGLENKTLELLCNNKGIINALALAFNLNLDDTFVISTLPECCAAAWENALYPVSNNKHVQVNDIVKVDFSCSGGILNLRVQPDDELGQNKREIIYLPSSAMNFLTKKPFLNNFLDGAKEAALKMKHLSEVSTNSITICDITPFPIASLFVMSMFPDAKLYIEEECLLEILREIGINAKLTEDLEEEVDLLFLWPVTKEGTLQDGIIKKILMYRLMMAEGGVVFPQEIDLVVDAICSPEVVVMTQVDDANTCGVKVAEVLNIAKTNHQVDVDLDMLPHTSIIPQPLPVLRLSLTTGNVDPLQTLCEQTEKEELLTIGGDIVSVLVKETPTQSSVLHAFPYWFILRGDKTSKFSVSTRDQDSPCKQSLLVPKHFLKVTKEISLDIKVIWRDGIFNAMIPTGSETAD